MTRRTKIVCTLGPSCATEEMVLKLAKAGMDVARLNFSHGTHEDHGRMIEFVRSASASLGKQIPILQDLQGPKIRIGEIAGGGMLIQKGDEIRLASSGSTAPDILEISYPDLHRDVHEGRRILIDDGLIELEVQKIDGEVVVTEVVVGGVLRSRKGVNLPHLETNSPALTEKDIEDLKFGIDNDVDFIALSFVRSKEDVEDLITRVKKSGKSISVIAKIEKPEAVEKFDTILNLSDGIMVARGDLGIEMSFEQVPVTQKRIISSCLQAAKPVITATQMLDSMIQNPRPTRAEASDVANAVMDGSDAVMLSGETAAGKYPVLAVETMVKIIKAAEANQYQHPIFNIHPEHEERFEVMIGISYTATELAVDVGAVGIACLSNSGATARAIARHRTGLPQWAFSDRPEVASQVNLLWATRGFHVPFQENTDQGVHTVHESLKAAGLVNSGDLIVITAGMPLPAKGQTNMVLVSTVP